MTTLELEQVIREYFLDIYKKEYIGKITIDKLPIGYKVSLGLATPEKPMVIYAELPDDKFLKFFRQELRTKRFNLVYYGELNKVYPYDCGPRNTQCICQEMN